MGGTSSADKVAAGETDEVDLFALCLTGEGVTLSVPRSMIGYDLRSLIRCASRECKADAESNLGRARDCWNIATAVLHIHTNRCVQCMAVCLWAPNLGRTFCDGRRYAT